MEIKLRPFEKKILAFVVDPANSDRDVQAIADATGYKYDSVITGISSLKRAGLIEKVFRPTPAGKEFLNP